MPRVLVTGAGRGIGLEFARQYRADGCDVLATCRNADAAAALEALGCETAILDVTDAAAIDQFAAGIPMQSLDVAILNAGTAGQRTPVLEPTSPDDFDAVMRTNVFGPMRLIAVLADRVAPGGRIAVLSSRMGSIGITSNGRSVLYRASKAGLNAVARAASFELAPRGVIVVVLSPGWVKTDMGGPGADITPQESAAGIKAVIAGLSMEHTGKFYKWNGEIHPW